MVLLDCFLSLGGMMWWVRVEDEQAGLECGTQGFATPRRLWNSAGGRIAGFYRLIQFDWTVQEEKLSADPYGGVQCD